MYQDRNNNKYMEKAVELARQAKRNGEIPVGAVVVYDDKVIGEGQNCQIGCNDPTGHAEIVALREAAKNIGNFRLDGAKIFSTVKPCPMCVEAIKRARISKVFFGARKAKPASHKLEYGRLNSYSKECKSLIKNFFKDKRK
ncbi:MAG: nucleoside deaminase [Elusimicrobiota bacterium]